MNHVFSRLFFSVVLLCHSFLPAVDVVDILALASTGQTIPLNQISVLNAIPMPQSLRDFLNKLAIITPQVVQESKPEDFSLGASKYTAVKTIVGGVIYEGITLEVKIRILTKAGGDKISVLVGLPSAFQFAKIDSKLSVLNKLDLAKVALAYSQDSYRDADWSLDVETGVNFLSIINATGEVGGLLKRVGQNMNQIKVAGTINPAITGSRFILGLGAGVKLGIDGKLGQATGLFFVITMIETAPTVPGVSIAVQAGLSINIPGQINPIAMSGEFKYTPPTLLSLAGWMPKGSFYGPPAFGVDGLALGEFGLSVGVDLAEAAATAGLIPISQFGLAGTIQFGSTIISATGSINYSTNPDLLLIGSASNLYLKDLVSFAGDIIDRAAKVVGKKTQIQNLSNELPPIGFKTVKVYIVPKDTTFLNVFYKKGIEVDVVMDIVNTSVGCAVRVADTGFKGVAYIKGLSIGPVKILAGPVRKQERRRIKQHYCLSLMQQHYWRGSILMAALVLM